MIRDGSLEYHDDLAPLLVPIDSVQQHVDNYNNGDVEKVMDSIAMSGMYRPIYVQDSTNFIIAGNHTWQAAKELGAKQIPVVRLDIDDATALRIMVADNEIARMARPDSGQLVKILDELNSMTGLLGTGISEAELEQIRAMNELALDPDDGDHKSWPSLCFQVPPHVKRHFLDMTSMAGGDTERFQLLMKLAGWDGKK